MKTDLEGRRLGGRYLLESRIAAGGMGTVWRGRDEVLKRPVAVKVLHENLAADDEVLERFRMEAVAAARLSHPCVVRVFDTGVDAGTCYIVMELLEPRTLAQLLEEEGPLEPQRAVGILLRVLEALAHAHAGGVVHRDIKPGNVMVTTDGTVKVADFGIAKAAFGGDMTTTGKLLGTARYLAPEQVEGGGADPRSDLYAAGLVLYEMLTGRVPFEAETELATAMIRLTEEPRPPRSLRAGIPRELEAAVLRALARDPDARFSDATEMASSLARQAGQGAAVERPPDDEEEQEAPSFFRSWMLVPLSVIVLASAAIAIGFALGRLEFGGPLGIRTREPAPQARALVFTVTDHDPEAGDGENPEYVPLVADDDVATFWETEGYFTPDLGGAKSGVGILLDLGRVREVSRVTIRSPLPGWTFEIRSGIDLDGLRRLEDTAGRRSFVAGGRTPIALDAVRTQYLLVWITELAPDEGGKYRARIGEVRVLGS